MPHLFVDISAHGFGHLAQTGPVLGVLAARLPDLQLTIRSGLPAAQLARRIAAPFRHIAGTSDVAFLMHDATRVDEAATAAAYRAAHADWPARVAREADELAALAPDLVLANVSALPLAGAKAAGIHALAMCSLNWADQFSHLFAGADWAAPIHAQLHAAYAGADAFLRCMPAMPMLNLPNRRPIPPLALTGANRRHELDARLGHRNARLVLVAMGGIEHPLSLEHWPQTPGIHWLVGDGVRRNRNDVTAYPTLGLAFPDLLASVDAVVTKPGYGMFVEAASAGTPLLYLRRKDWPEQDVLIDWLREHATCAELTAAAFVDGCFVEQLDTLWAQPQRQIAADGAAAAAAIVAGYL